MTTPRFGQLAAALCSATLLAACTAPTGDMSNYATKADLDTLQSSVASHADDADRRFLGIDGLLESVDIESVERKMEALTKQVNEFNTRIDGNKSDIDRNVKKVEGLEAMTRQTNDKLEAHLSVWNQFFADMGMKLTALAAVFEKTATVQPAVLPAATTPASEPAATTDEAAGDTAGDDASGT